MLILHVHFVLTFIDIFQHRSPRYSVLGVPFKYCLIILPVQALVHGT